jgi:hypothetical protein
MVIRLLAGQPRNWEEQKIFFFLSKAPRKAPLGSLSLPFSGYGKKWLGHESKAMNSNEWKLPLHSHVPS